jgi:STE24 endopeptidase
MLKKTDKLFDAASMKTLLVLFIVLRFAQQLIETLLARANQRYSADPDRLAAVGRILGISDAEMAKASAYSRDYYFFNLIDDWLSVGAMLVFIVFGGLGFFEAWARDISRAFGLGTAAIPVGIAFFALLGLANEAISLPFDLYATFHIEEKHGFNRQTLRCFFTDRLKALAIAVALGVPILAAILWVMERMGPAWWLWAWAITVGFSLFTAFIYPTAIAPLFNRFTPFPDGELRDGIVSLVERIGFRVSGVFMMDASRRTVHGNAYFTGLFGHKRIVLFDTLVSALDARQAIAVLAHELGHFKLHHVRWTVLRGAVLNGLLFFSLSRLLHLAPFYSAFDLCLTSYGALVVFGLWFSLATFLLRPILNALSRRHEFAADAFALANGARSEELGTALKKLRGHSRQLPLSHPLYSRVYHSHPPLLERLRAMGAL